MLPLVVGEFRVGADPNLRFAPSGVAVCNIRAVASKRKEVNGEWVDDKTCWVTLTGFKKQAENMAESFKVGDLVDVTGRLSMDEWEKDGVTRTSASITVDSIGHSTKWDPSVSNKAERSGGGGGGQQRAATPAQQDPANNPWVDPNQGDEPPF